MKVATMFGISFGLWTLGFLVYSRVVLRHDDAGGASKTELVKMSDNDTDAYIDADNNTNVDDTQKRRPLVTKTVSTEKRTIYIDLGANRGDTVYQFYHECTYNKTDHRRFDPSLFEEDTNAKPNNDYFGIPCPNNASDVSFGTRIRLRIFENIPQEKSLGSVLEDS